MGLALYLRTPWVRAVSFDLKTAHSSDHVIAHRKEAFHATSCGFAVQPRSHCPRNPDRHQILNGRFGICLQTTKTAKLPIADGEGLYTRGGVVRPFDQSKMRNWEV